MATLFYGNPIFRGKNLVRRFKSYPISTRSFVMRCDNPCDNNHTDRLIKAPQTKTKTQKTNAERNAEEKFIESQKT